MIKKIRHSNPNIFNFTINDTFIYEPKYSSIFYNKLNNKNDMKPTEIEVKYLDSLIDKFSLNNNESKLYVLPFFKIIIDNLKKNEPKKIKMQLLLKK